MLYSFISKTKAYSILSIFFIINFSFLYAEEFFPEPYCIALRFGNDDNDNFPNNNDGFVIPAPSESESSNTDNSNSTPEESSSTDSSFSDLVDMKDWIEINRAANLEDNNNQSSIYDDQKLTYQPEDDDQRKRIEEFNKVCSDLERILYIINVKDHCAQFHFAALMPGAHQKKIPQYVLPYNFHDDFSQISFWEQLIRRNYSIIDWAHMHGNRMTLPDGRNAFIRHWHVKK